MKRCLNSIVLILLMICAEVNAQSLADTVEKVKPSIVGIGVYDPLGSPRASIHGTGFAIGDGTLVATNFHVIDTELDRDSRQYRAVFVGQGFQVDTIKAEVVKTDETRDLAILKIDRVLPSLKLGSATPLRDGTDVAFTGFPIGSILGLYPATHRGIISAYTPVVTPSASASQLNIEMMKRLRDPFFLYQMDATAYPGNSGSPVYDQKDGKVIAVINKVFVKKTKESVLSDPSGITYAIPVRYLQNMLSSIE